MWFRFDLGSTLTTTSTKQVLEQEDVDIDGVAVNRKLLILFVQIQTCTLDDNFLDGGNRVDIMSAQVWVRLGLPTSKPTPYWLRMADQASVNLVELIPNVCMEVPGIPYNIALCVILNKAVNEAYSMLLG